MPQRLCSVAVGLAAKGLLVISLSVRIGVGKIGGIFGVEWSGFSLGCFGWIVVSFGMVFFVDDDDCVYKY